MTDTNNEVLHQVTCIAREYRDGILDDTLMVREMTAALSARASAGEGGELAARFQRAADAANERANEHAGLNREWYLGRKDAFEDAITMLTADPQPAQAGDSGGGGHEKMAAYLTQAIKASKVGKTVLFSLTPSEVEECIMLLRTPPAKSDGQ